MKDKLNIARTARIQKNLACNREQQVRVHVDEITGFGMVKMQDGRMIIKSTRVAMTMDVDGITNSRTGGY